jgi:DNA repair protein RecO (recombination protein O)
MLSKTDGIVLHTINYGDSSLIAHIYTREYGRKTFIINGVRKKNSKTSVNYFQPLTILHLEVYIKQNRDIQRIKELKLAYPVFSIPEDIKKNSIALFISEILYKTLKEEEKNTELFDFLSHSLRIFDIQKSGIANFHIIFLFKYSKYMGIFPENHTEIKTYIRLNTPYQLMHFLESSFENAHQFQLDSKTRSNLLSFMINYYQSHLEGMGEIKSFPILKEVFS